ncbi:hypothetical protein Q604_UNBC12745G0001, partial [human gut metagenome]
MLFFIIFFMYFKPARLCDVEREIPAAELVFHDSAQQAMQRNQRR